MMIDTGEMSRIRLDGDWSMAGVADKFSALSKFLVRLLNPQTSPKNITPEIDLAGVTDFDACGCQLLALFVRSLRQNGIRVQLSNLPDSFKSKIHYLGFDHELNLSI